MHYFRTSVASLRRTKEYESMSHDASGCLGVWACGHSKSQFDGNLRLDFYFGGGGGLCKERSPEVNSNFGNLNGEKKTTATFENPTFTPEVSLSVFLGAAGALGGFPSEGRRWYCSLWFASVGLIIQWFCRQRGILGVQTRSSAVNSWTVTVPIVPPKQCLHFDVCDAWLAEGSFFNLCLSPQIPPSIHRICPLELQKLNFFIRSTQTFRVYSGDYRFRPIYCKSIIAGDEC